MVNKYVIVISYDQTDGKCSECEFAGKSTIVCETKEELINEWIFQVNEGRNIEVYKKISLGVNILDEVDDD